MQKKTISLALCLAMVVSMLAVGFTATSAASVDSAAAGVSKIESADDFTWDNANVYFLLTDRFYNGDTSNDHSRLEHCSLHLPRRRLRGYHPENQRGLLRQHGR